MFIFDAHLDLSFNALTYNRDLRMSIAELRRLETGMQDLGGRARGTVSLPELRQANVGIVVATLLAGCMKPAGPGGGWNSPQQAHAMTQGQLAWYRAMEDAGELVPLRNRDELQSHFDRWQTLTSTSPDSAHCTPESTTESTTDHSVDRSTTTALPIGYILSLEGADSIRDLSDLQRMHAQGLRAIGPAHYGVGRYASGHDQHAALTPQGRELLHAMDELDMILDVTHLSEPTFWDALDVFEGPVWASHHNCRALVDDPRQLSDEQIKALAQRNAVIGIAFDIWMVVPGWKRGVTTHATYPRADLDALADHVDHVCQLLGTTAHTGLGTDLDGGYGTEQTPADLDTIADLETFVARLRRRGYSEEDLAGICYRHFFEFVLRAWK